MAMTEIENTSLGVESAFLFFYFLFFLFVSCFHLLPFHYRQNKMCGSSILSAKLRDKTEIKLGVL